MTSPTIMYTDTQMLDWLVRHRDFRVQGNDERGWFVLDCSDGLTFVSERECKTYREAIAQAIEHTLYRNKT